MRYSCHCGRSYEVADGLGGTPVRCGSCGRTQVIPPPLRQGNVAYPPPVPAVPGVPPAVSSAPPPREARCPVCLGTNFQRLQLVYESGSKTTTHAGVGLAHAHGSNAVVGFVSEGQTQTMLAARAAPPERMETTVGRIILGVVCLIVVGLSLVLLVPLVLQSPENAVGESAGVFLGCFMVFVLAPAILAVVCFVEASREHREVHRYNTVEWPRQLAAWRRTFVCLRCGHTWMPF